MDLIGGEWTGWEENLLWAIEQTTPGVGPMIPSPFSCSPSRSMLVSRTELSALSSASRTGPSPLPLTVMSTVTIASIAVTSDVARTPKPL